MTITAIQLCAASEEPAGMLWDWGADPDLWLYRERTQAILRRFFKLSLEAGRLPSILGQEFFRSHVTSYHMSSFEDMVIFVHDVERCVERLDPFARRLIGRIALQGFSQDEAARMLRCNRRTVTRRYPEAIDKLSEIFLEVGLIRRFSRPGESGREFVKRTILEIRL
jgi:DNA-directed RNA polymerase specialized sigma24 family protein